MECDVLCFDTLRDDKIRVRMPSADVLFPNGLHQVGGDSVTAVWLRQKPVVPMPWWSPIQHDANRFSESEWRNVIQTMEVFIPSDRWVNRPEPQRKINYKPAQLNLAKRVGFRVPRTEITNDPDVVAEMIGQYGKVIYKNLSGFVFSDQTGILTSLVTQQQVREQAASICRAPGIYQEFVEKSFEVRVTSVGNRHFAARIETPQHGPARIDWRHAHSEDIFRSYSVPAEVEEMIRRYLDEAELRYGAFDFIVTPGGEWVFLECNPAGQFLWIEHTLGYPISQAIAEELIGSHDASKDPTMPVEKSG